MIVFVLNDSQTPAARLTVRTAELLLPDAEVVPLTQPAGGKLNQYLKQRKELKYMVTLPSGMELLRSFRAELSGWMELMKEKGLEWLRIQSSLPASSGTQEPAPPQAVTIWTRSALACGELSGFADESDLPFNHYTDYDKYVQIRSICPGHVLSSDSFRPLPSSLLPGSDDARNGKLCLPCWTLRQLRRQISNHLYPLLFALIMQRLICLGRYGVYASSHAGSGS